MNEDFNFDLYLTSEDLSDITDECTYTDSDIAEELSILCNYHN